jgi:hypothetical protein
MKKMLVILGLITLIGTGTSGVLAQAQQQSQLPPCASGSVWNQCFGTKNYPNGDKYAGEWVGGKASGQGTYTSKASGAMYSGQFAADTFSGDGTMTWANGAKFIGQWKNDSAVSGTITYANGTTAVGTIRNAVFYASAQQPQAVATQQPPTVPTQQPQAGVIHQAAVAPQIKLPPCQGKDTNKWNMCVGTLDNFGESYIGEWKNGKYHGQGKLKTASGRVQAGEFKDGEYIARQTVAGVRALLANRKRDLPPCQGSNPTKFDMCSGTFLFSEGVKYTGEWERGMLSGQGVLLFPSGGTSEGTFAEGALNGLGISIAITANGQTTIVGEFIDDKANGMVTVIFPNGEYVGQAKESMYHGEGKLTTKKGDVIVGEFINGLPDGPISASMSDGEKYVGQMKEGEYDGFGELTRADGVKYSGEFKDGGYHGKGTLITAKGEKFVGEFRDGQYISAPAAGTVRFATVLPDAKDNIYPFWRDCNDDEVNFRRCLDEPSYKKACLATKNITFKGAINGTDRYLSTRLMEIGSPVSELSIKWEGIPKPGVRINAQTERENVNVCVVRYVVAGVFSGKMEKCRVVAVATGFGFNQSRELVINESHKLDHKDFTCRLN